MHNASTVKSEGQIAGKSDLPFLFWRKYFLHEAALARIQ